MIHKLSRPLNGSAQFFYKNLDNIAVLFYNYI